MNSKHLTMLRSVRRVEIVCLLDNYVDLLLPGNALESLSPQINMPMHCKGWQAIKRQSETSPDASILNSFGSKYGLALSPSGLSLKF